MTARWLAESLAGLAGQLSIVAGHLVYSLTTPAAKHQPAETCSRGSVLSA